MGPSVRRYLDHERGAGGEGPKVIALPDMEAHETIVLPLCLRGATVGPHTIGMLFHYEPEGT